MYIVQYNNYNIYKPWHINMYRLQSIYTATTDHIAHISFMNIVTTCASILITLDVVGLLYEHFIHK